MALSREGVFLWDEFCRNFIEGGFYEFEYKGQFINVGLEIEGIFRKKEKWIFATHKHDNNGNDIYSIYKTPQLLLENARIDGKTLKELWDKLQLV